MKSKVIKEAGYEEACIGLSLSWTSTPERSKEVLPKLAHKQGGHNKAIESITVWIDIDAPRYLWSEFDTYRIGVTKQSESTMHTITKRLLTQDDFENPIFDCTLEELNNIIAKYQKEEDPTAKKELFMKIKNNLPEGFLQRRIVCTNYKTLQNMYHQRKNHRLPQWHQFFDDLELEHPEFIYEEK